MGVYRAAVAGESHANSDGSSRQGELRRCHRNELVTLVREPDNPYDGDAVAVISARGVQIGYVSSKASWIAEAIDDGREVRARIDSINSGDSGLLGAVLWIGTDKDARDIEAKAVQPRSASDHAAQLHSIADRAPAAPAKKPANGCIAAIIATIVVVGGVNMCSQRQQTGNGAPATPPTTESATAVDSAATARAEECRARIERAMQVSDTIRVTDRNRIEIDDRLWNEMTAAAKRGLASDFRCMTFGGKAPEDLAMMDFVVVYGARSGHRLAMAGSQGVSLE